MKALRLALFALGSAGLAWVSRRSLGRPRMHGFARFWAWEAILGLVLLRLPGWFRDPLAGHQLASWTLLLASPAPLVLGLSSLRRAGRPSAARDDAGLLGLEKTTQLVTTGIYRYVRHPLYGSLLLLAWGGFWKHPDRAGAVLAAGATAGLVAAAKAEERENLAYFGPDYATYMRSTRLFFPFLF